MFYSYFGTGVLIFLKIVYFEGIHLVTVVGYSGIMGEKVSEKSLAAVFVRTRLTLLHSRAYFLVDLNSSFNACLSFPLNACLPSLSPLLATQLSFPSCLLPPRIASLNTYCIPSHLSTSNRHLSHTLA